MIFDQVLSWAIKAKPGEQLIYHKGNQLSNFQNQHDYSDAVWGARYCHNAGIVTFHQKRDGSQFFYVMTKRRSVERPEPAYAPNGRRIDGWVIPYRFYRASHAAAQIGPEGRGKCYGQEGVG